MKKKVLFVNSSLTAGGSEKVMSIIANEFAKFGHDVSMALVRKSNKENYSINENIKLIRFSYKHKNALFKIIERILKLRKLIKKNNYDIVISFMHTINTTVLLSTMGLKIPVIVSERCDPNQFSKISRLFDNIVYRKAKNIVLQTEEVRKYYPNSLQNKMVVIINPISDNIPEPYTGKKINKIVSAGRLVEQKNFPMLIDAFANIIKTYDYKLYIYGDGILKSNLIEQIKKYNLVDKVFLPGYVSNVDELMKDAKMYVCSSNYEGISNSMLEAMAMGIPTISTNCPVGGAAMMINDHENGILIPVGDREKLTEAMLEIIENNELANKISNNSKKIRNDINSTQIAKKWEKLI